MSGDSVVLHGVNLADALGYDPFGGDESYCDGLSDRVVRFRKLQPAGCQMCRSDIIPGTIGRAKAERNNEERKIATWRWCTACTAAMAVDLDQGSPAAELRCVMPGSSLNVAVYRSEVAEMAAERREDGDAETASLYDALLLVSESCEAPRV